MFPTASSDDQTFKDTLESSGVRIVSFDVRNDSDALYSYFQVKVADVQDVRLLGKAIRIFNWQCVYALAKCIETDAPMSSTAGKWSRKRGQSYLTPRQAAHTKILTSGRSRKISKSIAFRMFCSRLGYDSHTQPRFPLPGQRKCMQRRWLGSHCRRQAATTERESI